MPVALVVMVANIVFGLLCLALSNQQYKQGRYENANWYFLFFMCNTMTAVYLVAMMVYRILIA